MIYGYESIDVLVKDFENTVFNVTMRNRIRSNKTQELWTNEERWKRLLKSSDSKKIC